METRDPVPLDVWSSTCCLVG